MMKLFACLVVLSGSAVAAAEPCRVEIVRAPEEVRPLIEDWVKAETRCGPPLRVRILATEGGYYVLAQDASGRVRERLVPDAQTAAVLIASWVADDGAAVDPEEPVPAPIVAPVAEPDPVVAPPAAAPTPVAPAPSIMAPGMVETIAPAPTAGKAVEKRRTFGIAGLADPVGGGMRLELDLKQTGPRWKGLVLGIAGGWWHHEESFSGSWDMQLSDLSVLGQAAYDLRRGNFGFRASVGVGVAMTHGQLFDASSSSMETVTAATPTGEGVLSGGYWVSSRWQLRGGVSINVMPQNLQSASFSYSRGVEPRLMFGLNRVVW
jgi:hypothetical protein